MCIYICIYVFFVSAPMRRTRAFGTNTSVQELDFGIGNYLEKVQLQLPLPHCVVGGVPRVCGKLGQGCCVVVCQGCVESLVMVVVCLHKRVNKSGRFTKSSKVRRREAQQFILAKA